MGKGGGGGGPSQTTAYQTNLPEYAQPYVMNMLGAAQNQLFTTTPGVDGAPGEITGFRPYTPYSNDPTDYFAGPSDLQQRSYGEASNLQTPGGFRQGQTMAGQAGQGMLGTVGAAGGYGQQGASFGSQGQRIGQEGMSYAMPAFSAGRQYANQVTDPNEVGSYMSPYQQQVTDIAKGDAMRNAQITEQGNRLAAARQGTYGGARQALGSLEREKSLNANLSNIQAQGSQAAYDRAIQNMQYGSNLGLQGIQTGLQGIGQGLAGTAQGMQGAGLGLQGVNAQQAGYAGANQAAATAGQIAAAQSQSDLARLGLQNQMGQQQQQYQQGIINQSIQDYATEQQYPYMQLSTMSNLLRGLPMQSMSTQQYQAQPSAMQQGIGLLGAGASLYGGVGRKEGGTIKQYAGGGEVKRGLENKIDDIGDAGGAKGLQALLAKTNSPAAKELIMARMREEGIAGGNTGKLGTNMAGGGIVAFEAGGDVEEMTDEERAEYIKNNEYLQRSKALSNLPEAAGNFLRKYNPITGSAYREGVANFFNESPEDQATRFRKASSRRDQAANPTQEVPAVKTATQRQDDSDRADALASIGQFSKADYNKAKENLTASAAPSASGKGKTKDTVNSEGIAGTSTGRGATGIEAILAENRRLAGIDEGPGAKSAAFMKMLEDREAGKAGARDSDRYLRMAEAFAKFGSTAGPIGATAAEALGGFAKGEAASRKEQDKMDIEGAKLQADAERVQRLEAMGLVKEARAAQDKLDDRKKDYAIASMQQNRPSEFDKMYGVFAEGEKAAGRKPSFEAFRKAYSGADEDLVRLTKADAAVKILKDDLSPGGYMQLAASKKPEDRQKAAQLLAAVYQRYGIDPTTGSLTGSQTASAGGGNRLKFDASGKQI